MSATDEFSEFGLGMSAPAANAFSITPHDTNELSYVTRGLYVGTSGDIKVVTAEGDTVTFVSLAAGIIHPLRVKQVYATDTDADDIIGVY